MDKKKYVSGKIAGLSESEMRENFERGCNLIVNEYEKKPLSPLDIPACLTEDCNTGNMKLADGSYLHTWECYLKHDIAAMLLECDEIWLLPNWHDSQGAKFELLVAEKVGFPVYRISRDYMEARLA